jgi:hypothetical protein
MRMSEFEPDPSASTGRFRAFVERGDDDTARARRPAVSPAVLIVAAVMVIVVVILVVALA